jgi:hypothetical protein
MLSHNHLKGDIPESLVNIQYLKNLIYTNNNINQLPENILPSLLSICAEQGDTPVDVDGTSVDSVTSLRCT